MTPEEFSKGLPQYHANQLGVKPPLVFRGVSARIFPLRANLDTLQQLCDGYLNFVPREAGYFRVPLPYVFIVLLNYGQMSEAVMRSGWFSQIEVYFGLPVEWYKLVDGQYVFHDWGVITPYIFVNDDISVPVGRTVYGFPKVLASVKQTDSQWMKNPGPRRTWPPCRLRFSRKPMRAATWRRACFWKSCGRRCRPSGRPSTRPLR